MPLTPLQFNSNHKPVAPLSPSGSKAQPGKNGGESLAAPEPDPPAPAKTPHPVPDLKHLIHNMPGMVYRCRIDPDWSMEFVSRGCIQLTGYPPEELAANSRKYYWQAIHPADRSTVQTELNKALGGKTAYDLEYRILTADHQEKWVRDSGAGVYGENDEVVACEGFISDITDRKASQERAERQVTQISALRKVDLAITASFDLRLTFDILLEQAIQNLNVDAADLLLFNDHTQTLKYAAGRGFRTPALQFTRLRLGEGFAGAAALNRSTVHISNLSKSMGDLARAAHLAQEGFDTYIGVPLLAKGQVKGVLEVFTRSHFEPDSDWLYFLEALAGQAAIAIDNANLFNELQHSNMELALAYDATLEGWSKALELRDQETEGHAQRVVDLTLRLAQEFGINSEELPNIRRGALLHDIGKMAVPDSILFKPGPLTEEEWQIMRQHPVYAYELLAPIANLNSALDIPYCHHEKWNGTGYPRRLRRDQIPLAARLFAVVDVWDALRSDRPYRKAWPEEKALAYIREQSGEHFDPAVVEVFTKLV